MHTGIEEYNICSLYNKRTNENAQTYSVINDPDLKSYYRSQDRFQSSSVKAYQGSNALQFHENNAQVYQGSNVMMFPDSNAPVFQNNRKNKNVTLFLVNNVILFHDNNVQQFQGKIIHNR